MRSKARGDVFMYASFWHGKRVLPVSCWAWQHPDLGRRGCVSRQPFFSLQCPKAIPNASSSSAFSGRQQPTATAAGGKQHPKTGLGAADPQREKGGRARVPLQEEAEAAQPRSGRAPQEPPCATRARRSVPEEGLRALRGSKEHGAVFSWLAFPWGQAIPPLTLAVHSDVRSVCPPSLRAPRRDLPAHARPAPRQAALSALTVRTTANSSSACKQRRAAGRRRQSADVGGVGTGMVVLRGLRRRWNAYKYRFVPWLAFNVRRQRRWGGAGCGRGGAARGRRSVYSSCADSRSASYLRKAQSRKVFVFFVSLQDASVRSWKLPGQNNPRWRRLRNAAESIYSAVCERLRQAGAGAVPAARR